MRTSGHSRLSSTQPFSPPQVWHDSDLVDDDCEQHANRRERLTGQAPDSHGDSRMSRDRGKGEHGAVMFIGSAKEVTGGEITKNRGRHVLHFGAAHRCIGSEDAGAVETQADHNQNRRKCSHDITRSDTISADLRPPFVSNR